MVRNFSENVLPFWLEKVRSGQKACLVTLVGIDSSAPRPLGSQITVGEDGASVGYITGGCAESAIVTEALAVIKTGENRLVRYGEGSPYKDIVLPCGSGIDIYFDVKISDGLIGTVQSALDTRKPAALQTDLVTGESSNIAYTGPLPERDGNWFYNPYHPPFKLFIAGKGPIVPALANLAVQSGFIVETASPEPETLADIKMPKTHLTGSGDFIPATLDSWCAAITLFHDHDWEPPILAPLLESSCFYIGALGSRRTHEDRKIKLAEFGVTEAQISKLYAPVGLDIQATTPVEIAIAILADIIRIYRTHERGPARW